jgi:hypothetical protein
MNPALGMAAIQPEKRHVLFSLSDDDNYSTKVMAAVHKKVKQKYNENEKLPNVKDLSIGQCQRGGGSTRIWPRIGC